MKLFGKMLLPILVIFVTFTTFIILAKPLLLKYDVDSHVLLSANLLFLFLGILVFFIQKNALANKNPNVFIRSIIAGMMIKMFSTVLAILIYVVFTGKNYNTKAVFISLLMYLVYLAAEVIALSAENKKKMAKEKLEFAALLQYLPEASYELVLQYIVTHKVQLTITRSRTTVLGNYRHAHANKGHRISVNGDLNKYAFLITLLHEIAHLITFETHGNKVAPHGQEWKYQFGKILSTFLEMQFFPLDIKAVLLKSIKNPAASSCADEKLLRVLKNYDENKDGIFFVEQILLGDKFKIKGNRVFEKGEKIRKRFKCKEIATGKWYLFSPISEVIRVA